MIEITPNNPDYLVDPAEVALNALKIIEAAHFLLEDAKKQIMSGTSINLGGDPWNSHTQSDELAWQLEAFTHKQRMRARTLYWRQLRATNNLYRKGYPVLRGWNLLMQVVFERTKASIDAMKV